MKTKGAKSKNHKLKYRLVYDSLQNFIRKEKEKGELPTAEQFRQHALYLLRENGFCEARGWARIEYVIKKQLDKQSLVMFRQLKFMRDGKAVKFIDVVEE